MGDEDYRNDYDRIASYVYRIQAIVSGTQHNLDKTRQSPVEAAALNEATQRLVTLHSWVHGLADTHAEQS